MAFGASQFALFGVYASMFYSGAMLVKYINLSYDSMFISLFSIMFAAFGVGNAAPVIFYLFNLIGVWIIWIKIFFYDIKYHLSSN